MSAYRVPPIFYLILLSLLAAALPACSSANPEPSTPSASPTAEVAFTETPTPTLAPSATPTTPPAEKIILVAPEGEQQIEPVIAEMASQAGLEYRVQPSLAAADLGAEVRLVVALPPDPGLVELAAAWPDIQFLAVGIPSLDPGDNLSVIGSTGGSPDAQGFLAGYLAAAITADWRVGVLSVSDTPEGRSARLGFINGTVYYCGLCRPAYPPYIQYPVFAEVPAGAADEAKLAAAESLINQAVTTVYVAPGAASPTVYELLSQSEVRIIGGEPAPPGLNDWWMATIHSSQIPAVQQMAPELLQGEGGLSASLPLLMTDVNETLFSPGRQRIVEEVRLDLQEGYIDTGVDPATGEPR